MLLWALLHSISFHFALSLKEQSGAISCNTLDFSCTAFALHYVSLHCDVHHCTVLCNIALDSFSLITLCSVLHCESLDSVAVYCTACHFPLRGLGAIEREIGIITAASYSKDLSARFSQNFLWKFLIKIFLHISWISCINFDEIQIV